MRKLRLVSPNKIYKDQYMSFINECKEDIEKCGMRYYIPISNNNTFLDDIQQLINYEKGLGLPDGWIAATTYWVMDEVYNCILGTITIRHYLVGYLFFRGGHISYYVRLSERRKGYATKMLNLALKQSKKLQIDRVLITCANSNTGSAKTIKNNGGILHSEDIEDGESFQRYWIANK